MSCSLSALLCLAMSAGCAVTDAADADDADDGAGGKADDGEANGAASIYAVGNRLEPWDGEDVFLNTVQPTLARQCISCHGCGDSPCQLKFTSYEGVMRGSNENDLYSGKRLLAMRGVDYDPTNLSYGRVLDSQGNIDYPETEEVWRDQKFYSVVDKGDADASLMERVLTEAHDRIADFDTGFDEAFQLRKNLASRTFECAEESDPKSEFLSGRAMPLGLPPVEGHRTEAIQAWLSDGAQGLSEEAQAAVSTPANPAAVAEWEEYFNRDASPTGKLVSRYLYEHLFFAHLHLERSPGEFYRLVRSSTATGPIDELPTELVLEQPEKSTGLFGSEPIPFTYRLQKVASVLVAKNHIEWEVGPKDMERWSELFGRGPDDRQDWDKRADSGEFADVESELPFVYNAGIPADIRARFMMENSKQLVDGMVRGAVCTGSGATFAIRDRFWVWFLDPASDPSAQTHIDGEYTGGPRMGATEDDWDGESWDHLKTHTTNPARERRFLKKFRSSLQHVRPDGLQVSDMWDGQVPGESGASENAWITVMRHGKSATVQSGAGAGLPETIWVLDYANFERLYYNLVVQFKTWGHVGHKAKTWGGMSFVRSEGEDLYSTLYEPELRHELRAHPTRGWGKISSALFPSYGDCADDEGDTVDDCSYPTSVDFGGVSAQGTLDDRLAANMTHLADQMEARIGNGFSYADPLNTTAGPETFPARVTNREEVDEAFSGLTGWKNAGWEHLPEITLVRVHEGEQSTVFTILANRIHEAHERVYQEGLNRVPGEDTLSVIRGVTGHYPGLFVDLQMDDVLPFVKELAAVGTEQQWYDMVNRADVGPSGTIIDRRSPEFWEFIDEVQQQWFDQDPVQAAVLDISEYVWPQENVVQDD